MPLVIEARNLSKRFVLRHNAGEIKVRALGLLGARGAGAARGVLGASRRVPANRGWGVAGARRQEWLGQEHVPQAGRRNPQADRRTPRIRRGAHIASMIELGTGFHPELTGQENVL